MWVYFYPVIIMEFYLHSLTLLIDASIFIIIDFLLQLKLDVINASFQTVNYGYSNQISI